MRSKIHWWTRNMRWWSLVCSLYTRYLRQRATSSLKSVAFSIPSSSPTVQPLCQPHPVGFQWLYQLCYSHLCDSENSQGSLRNCRDWTGVFPLGTLPFPWLFPVLFLFFCFSVFVGLGRWFCWNHFSSLSLCPAFSSYCLLGFLWAD